MPHPTLRTSGLVLLLGLVCSLLAPALPAAMPVDLGAIEEMADGNLRITCTGQSKFTRNTTKLKEAATAEATKYCNARGKHLKVVSLTEHKGLYLIGEMPAVTLVFRPVDALEALTSPGPDAPAAAQGDFYATLIKLDDLLKKGIITEEEFKAEKKKILEHLK
jgi:hypothetical protein